MSDTEKERERQALLCPLYLQSSACLWPRSLGDCLAHRKPGETAQLGHLQDKNQVNEIK